MGDNLPSEHSMIIQVEKVPETGEAEAWANFNKRLNDLANQGYRVIHATDKYILLRRARFATRREEQLNSRTWHTQTYLEKERFCATGTIRL